MSDYYPEFYLRKRQREQAYRRVTVLAVGFLVLLAVGGIVGYFVVNAISTRQTAPGATPELAAQQQELQTEQQLASADVPRALTEASDQPPVDLSQIGYSESFPKVSVSISGTEPQDEATATDPAAADESGAQPAAVDQPAAEAAAEPQQPSPQDERVGSVTPADNTEAQRKAEQLKRQEQARRESEKREAAKKAEEQRKRDEAKRKRAEEEKAAQADEGQADVRAPAPQAGGYSYTVYGGTFLTPEDAEKKKSELSALGLSGNVIKAGGDHLLLIGKFDEQESATALANKLQGSGFGGAFVTRKAK